MAEVSALTRRAIELNLPLNSGVYKPNTEAWTEIEITASELHRRIRDEERHRRESKLWVVAVVAACASVISAMTALMVLLLS